jgi:signal transduction histidine kinase
VKGFARLPRWLDPRRSIVSRLLVGFFLAFLVPAGLFVFLLERRLLDLERSSVQSFAASRTAEATMRIRQDTSFRAELLARRAQIVEEAAWTLADAMRIALTEEQAAGTEVAALAADSHGHLWTEKPEEDSVAYLSMERANELLGRKDFVRTRKVATLMKLLRERRPSMKSMSVWTASGVLRHSPWLNIHEGIRQSGGALERFAFNRPARFPPLPPVSGDDAVWTPAFGGPRLTGDPRFVTLSVPVRSAAGVLFAVISVDVDARRYFIEALEPGEVQGDIRFALDGAGHALLMPPRAARVLGWRGNAGEKLQDSRDAARRRLAREVLASPETIERYEMQGSPNLLASARVRGPGWIFVEGLSSEALSAIGREAELEIQPRSYSDLRRDVLLIFVYLLIAVLLSVLLVARRISAPVSELVRAAEEIGRGKPAQVSRSSSPDELGRLATALEKTSRRVERRVETLRRLHLLYRASYRTGDLKEALAQCAEAIAAFTRAERVWFFLHDPATDRLKAAWPGWNLPEELVQGMEIPVESQSISGMVFRSGELYYSNDLERDPHVHRELQKALDARNGMFAPLKTEEATIGVVAAVNRPGGFGSEEADAMTSFADAASLMIRQARLTAELTGTVDELRRASRLKDHFLQNVNHELRTPLTSIVGWTDLFEEQEVDEKTLKRGLRQVRQSSRVLLALIDDLLDLARLDRGALSLDWKPVDLADVLQRSMDTVRLMADARGVALILAPLPEPLSGLRADPLRLQQVLWNLLVNAIRFTSRHGRIIVRVEEEPERFVISVEDDGIGIPESELPHVFERFRQVDGTPTRRYPGMGIGLSLARSIVELHGGTIWAESLVGQGSRFSFTLPIRPADRRMGRPEPAALGQEREEEVGEPT